MKNKEVGLIKFVALIFIILGYLTSIIYSGNNLTVSHTISFMSTHLVYPILLFIFGIYTFRLNIKDIKKECLIFLALSVIYNVLGFSLYYLFNGDVNMFLTYTLQTNIFTFIFIAYIFFYIVKKFDISTQILWGIGLLFSVINTLISFKYSFNDSGIILKSITSFLYSSSNIPNFSFLAWIIFPISGYIFEDVREEKKSEFYYTFLTISLFFYIIMVCYSKYVINGGPLIDFNKEYTFYHMNVYGAIMNVMLCIFTYCISYLAIKYLPNKMVRFMNRVSNNMIQIYLLSILIINTVFVYYLKGLVIVNFVELLLLFIIIFFIISFIAISINKNE